MLLETNLAQHQQIPKEYDLAIEDNNARNTFIFTEQDLPGFKAKNKARAEAAAAGIPAHLLRQKEREANSEQAQTYRRRGRRGRQEYYRKAIPSECASWHMVLWS